MKKSKVLSNFDFDTGLTVATGSAGSGKSLYLINTLIDLLENDTEFPEPSEALEELGYLLNSSSKIFIFIESDFNSFLKQVNFVLAKVDKIKQLVLTKKLKHYLQVHDLFRFNSYSSLSQVIPPSYQKRYIFIDGLPQYEPDPNLIGQRARDLQLFVKNHQGKDFIMMSTPSVRSPIKNAPNFMIGATALSYSANLIIKTDKKDKNEIECTVIKNRMGSVNTTFRLPFQKK